MRSKHIITAALTAIITRSATAAFNESCSWWWVDPRGRVTLTGDCFDLWTGGSTGNKVVSSLDLNHCIGVDLAANAMIWQHE
jgi:hypothetical protein